MADKTLNQVFGEIADAIREKNGSESAIKPINMAQEIAAIPTAPTLEGYYVLNKEGLEWFDHQTDDGTYCWWLSLNGREPINHGLMYVNTGSYAPDPVELNSDSIYIYRGEYSFDYVQGSLSDSGIYYYVSDSRILIRQDLVDKGVYQYRESNAEPFIPYEAPSYAEGVWYSDGQTLSSIELENHEYYYYNGDSEFTKVFNQEGVYYYSPNAGLKFLIEYDTSGVYYLGASDIASYKFNLNSGSAYIYNPGANPALAPVTGTLELRTDSSSDFPPLYVNQLIDVAQYKYFKIFADGKWFTVDSHDNKLTEYPFDENEIGYFDYYRNWHELTLYTGDVYRYEGGSDLRNCYLTNGSTYLYTDYGFQPVSGEGQRIYYYGAYGMTQSSISGDYFLCFKDGTDVTICDDEEGMEVVGGSAVIDTGKGTYKVIRLS